MKICQEILALSPTAIKALKTSFNADVEHINGIHDMASISLVQYYSGEESKEGSEAFLEKRSPDYSKWR
jgi:naphthoate synthase